MDPVLVQPFPSKLALSREQSLNSTQLFAIKYYRAIILDSIERHALRNSTLRSLAAKEYTNSYIESRVAAVGLTLASKLTNPLYDDSFQRKQS
jgi:hypothetical protein